MVDPFALKLLYMIINKTVISPLKERKAPVVAGTLSSRNLPVDRARELFKPSSRKSPSFDIQKSGFY